MESTEAEKLVNIYQFKQISNIGKISIQTSEQMFTLRHKTLQQNQEVIAA